MVADFISWELLVVAFAGGAFGAAIGALQSFSLAGLVVIVGELYALVFRTIDGAAPPVDLTETIAFGAVIGPHVAFGGGAAAAAFAARRGYLETDFEYHDAKNITLGLGSRPDVLAVGGVFGIVGYSVAVGVETLGVPTDPVALGVVLSALTHRIAFGYDLFGASPRALLDMSPYERNERREPSGGIASDGGRTPDRLAVEPWLAYQYRVTHVIALGVVVGVLGAYVAYLTASAFLTFGLSAFALAFLCAGVAQIPVTHHITLPASTAVLVNVETSGAVTPAAVATALPLGEALLLGALFGVFGAIVGELTQRIFYAHADTHFDPPAASIVVTTFVIGCLVWLGVFPDAAWIPMPG